MATAAAVRPMLAAVKEEAAIITTEVAVAARTGAVEATRAVEHEINPVAIRQAVQASVKESVAAGERCTTNTRDELTEDTSLLSSHLAHAPAPSALPVPSVPAMPTLPNPAMFESSIIAQTLKEESGVSFREALSNATQTGVEEQMDEMVDLAKALLGKPGQAAMKASAQVVGA